MTNYLPKGLDFAIRATPRLPDSTIFLPFTIHYPIPYTAYTHNTHARTQILHRASQPCICIYYIPHCSLPIADLENENCFALCFTRVSYALMLMNFPFPRTPKTFSNFGFKNCKAAKPWNVEYKNGIQNHEVAKAKSAPANQGTR
jgi:hypothetical protein